MRGERAYLTYRSQSIVEGSQGSDSRQTPEAGTEADVWRGLLTGSSPWLAQPAFL